jgi:hypothetical protein
MRWGRDLWAWVAGSLAAGYAGSLLGDAFGWSALVAPGLTFVVAAAFGWTRRGREVLEVFAPAVLVGYASFVGLAIARATDANAIATEMYGGGPIHLYGTVQITSWPLILVGGVAYAFAVAILAALPASSLVRPPRVDREADARFWTFVREHTQPGERKS